MPILENNRHELFCHGLAKGMTVDAAYEKAGYSQNRGNAARLNANESVIARVLELKGAASDGVVLTLAMKRKVLHDIVMTPIGSIDEHSILCQELTTRWEGGKQGRLKNSNENESPEYEVEKVKKPDILKAIELDAKLAGEFKAEEVNVNIDGMDDFLAQIRKPGLPQGSRKSGG